MADDATPSSPGEDPGTQPTLAPSDLEACPLCGTLLHEETYQAYGGPGGRWLAHPADEHHARCPLAALTFFASPERVERWNRRPHEHALTAARALLASVDHDNNGETIGMQRMGGNGGLISLKTTRAADTLRLALDKLDSGP